MVLICQYTFFLSLQDDIAVDVNGMVPPGSSSCQTQIGLINIGPGSHKFRVTAFPIDVGRNNTVFQTQSDYTDTVNFSMFICFPFLYVLPALNNYFSSVFTAEDAGNIPSPELKSSVNISIKTSDLFIDEDQMSLALKDLKPG